MKSLKESLFDRDLVKRNPTINGLTIYKPDWNKCEDYYQKRRKTQFANNSTVVLGDMLFKYNVVYNEDDCIVAIGRDGQDVYILCPETIYMNHKAAEIFFGDAAFTLTDYDANDFDVCFNWLDGRGWTDLGGGYRYPHKQKLKDAGFEETTGYIPITISNKAKDIIKKHIK